ncbi:ATP-binding protein [Brachyspira hyodysenteriae]|uniref:AAA family ATPase n=1 Tax=Brachyspira hyodysenteriae TaxID=159 RepID=UPI0022CD81DF|nr:AAA family ATPase [Brachyspira hyodysenteriae]MCZ9982277.1 ATP-binding protein [Brachyspira hyodysenteriae]
MELQLRNIGMIKEADITLDGLTLIAGENDTGKSTVGKALYSVVAGLNNAEKNYKEYVEEIKIYPILRNIVRKLENEFLKKWKDEHSLIRIRDLDFVGFQQYIGETLEHFIFDTNNLNNNFFKEYKKNLQEYDLYNCIENDIKEYFNILANKPNINEIKHYSIKQHILNELKNNIQSFNCEKSNISILEDNNKIINIDIINNQFNDDELIGNVYASNITYIETPFIFNIIENYITPYKLKKYTVDNHLIDLSKKIIENRNKSIIDTDYSLFEEFNKIKRISDKIQNNINGSIEYDNIKDTMFFKKNNNYIELSNTAVGIKSFAIIDLLLKAGIFNDKHILILDEPEVHLHPKWQIEYAKLMVKMAEELDIQILINSHSPYFIEAIQKYSEKSEKIADKTNFYLSEKQDDGYAVIKNVNDDIESIYKNFINFFIVLFPAAKRTYILYKLRYATRK